MGKRAGVTKLGRVERPMGGFYSLTPSSVGPLSPFQRLAEGLHGVMGQGERVLST
jgi:hypothetical protein